MLGPLKRSKETFAEVAEKDRQKTADLQDTGSNPVLGFRIIQKK